MILTGVTEVFSAAHRDPETGALHGHDYQVTAYFPAKPIVRMEFRREALREALCSVDHQELPAELWSAEALAEAFLWALSSHRCCKVTVARPMIGHIAEATP